eukprot:TRINITY_DN43715_c0_g1_i1.p2 TRINITY_DN43715_c0_g1~~TRINITY_DN43715_c0_g1_i1.p2  ORF type:complete len:150 (-),score=22.27 TRINITY_DN43715_c0_g1_i1:181-630(-)
MVNLREVLHCLKMQTWKTFMQSHRMAYLKWLFLNLQKLKTNLKKQRSNKRRFTMDIIEKTKEIGNEIEETFEKGYEKGKEVLSNVASHLPFANLAKKKSGDFHVEIDMPGVKKEDIDVKIDNNILTVSGERKMKKEVKKKDYYLSLIHI